MPRQPRPENQPLACYGELERLDNPAIIVKESAIAGKGCFAARALKAGEYVGSMVGVFIPKPTAEQAEHIYWWHTEEESWAFYVLSSERYFNHSRTPNCRIDDYNRFFALRNIKKGEELTFDYSGGDPDWEPDW